MFKLLSLVYVVEAKNVQNQSDAFFLKMRLHMMDMLSPSVVIPVPKTNEVGGEKVKITIIDGEECVSVRFGKNT